MSVRRYRKKPVEVEAIQFTGRNDAECLDFCRGQAIDPKALRPDLVIVTREGDMTASMGDWIIRGVAGEFYPCKPDIFDATYEAVEDPLIARALDEMIENPDD